MRSRKIDKSCTSDHIEQNFKIWLTFQNKIWYSATCENGCTECVCLLRYSIFFSFLVCLQAHVAFSCIGIGWIFYAFPTHQQFSCMYQYTAREGCPAPGAIIRLSVGLSRRATSTNSVALGHLAGSNISPKLVHVSFQWRTEEAYIEALYNYLDLPSHRGKIAMHVGSHSNGL